MTDSDFGDAEPEDGWDAGDPVPEQIENLARRVELLPGRVLIPRGNYVVTLQAVEDAVRRAKHERLHGRDAVRVEQLDEDIAFVRWRM